MKSDGGGEAALPEAPPDVVPSGHALAVVSRWLPPLADGEVDDLESGPPERLRPARCVLRPTARPRSRRAASGWAPSFFRTRRRRRCSTRCSGGWGGS